MYYYSFKASKSIKLNSVLERMISKDKSVHKKRSNK